MNRIDLNIVRMRKASFSIREIASKLKVSRDRVREVSIKNGIPFRGFPKRQKKSIIIRENIVKLHKEGVPDSEACKIVGVCYNQYLSIRKSLSLDFINDDDVYFKYSKRQKDILIGTLLGDGHLAHVGKGIRKTSFSFVMGHSWKQAEYMEWKREQIGLESNYTCVKTTLGNWSVRSESIPYRNLEVFYKMFYGKGRKRVNSWILSKLTPLGLAVWYMDDGTKNDTYYICTQWLCDDQCKLVIKFLKKIFDLDSTINYQTKDKRVIRIRAKDREKFRSIVEPHMVPSMKYKLL